MLMRLIVVTFAGLCLVTLLGCSGNTNPTTPTGDEILKQVQDDEVGVQDDRVGVEDDGVGVQDDTKTATTQLWGYFDIYLDTEEQTITISPNRTIAECFNVVDFLNANPNLLGFDINEVITDNPSFVDVDVDISLSHPLAGQTEYNGYDVRGIFIGGGGAQLSYNANVTFGDADNDQTMLNPDGFSRWFNAGEFLTPGILGYTPGLVATPTYTPNATLNPYKLFADGLNSHENAFEFVSTETGSENNVFSANAQNTRNYYLRFPLPNPDVTYGYAVVASWLDVDIHPANTPEVVATNISTTASNINFNTSDYCGNLVADISLAGFGKQPSTIFIDAEDLFSTSQSFDPSVIVVGGGDNYSTYHIDIPVDNVTSAGEKDFWVIAEYNDEDYSNEYGVPNNANGPLAAYFVGSVVIGTESCNEDPICDVQVITSMPIDGWDAGVPVEFDASGSYDPNDDPLSFEWDFDNDGVFGDSYDSGTDDNPTKIFTTSTQEQVCVKVADGKGGENSCCVDVDISVYQSKNIPLRSGVEARDITVVGSTGDLLILYSDGQVWEYPEPYTFGSTFSGTMFYDTGLTYLQYIEASSNGDSLVNSGTSGPPFASRSYYNNGANYSNHTSSSNYTWNSDGWCPTYVEENPTWDNRHCTWYNYSPPPLTRAICHGWDPDPPYQYLGGDGYFPPGVEGLGPDYIRHEYLVGTEVDSNGYVYCLENGPGTDRSVERRTYRLGSQNGPYWGGWGDDSGFGDTSPKFNDPKDITRDDDSTNTIYVLDELSTGDPAIKKFTWEGTPEGTFGDTTTISSTPLRIEGSQRTFPETNENLMFVLHGNATDGYFISIFTPTELTT